MFQSACISETGTGERADSGHGDDVKALRQIPCGRIVEYHGAGSENVVGQQSPGAGHRRQRQTTLQL
jgi:hypothetical protein